MNVMRIGVLLLAGMVAAFAASAEQPCYVTRPGEPVYVELELGGPVAVEPAAGATLSVVGAEGRRIAAFTPQRSGRYVLYAGGMAFAEVRAEGIGIREVAGLFGGLLLFLYGMDKASFALRRWASGTLRAVLYGVTASRLAGVAVGVLLAVALQSSSAATVMLVGLANAGLLSLEQAVPVVIGAALGTTVTVQIIAFDVADYSLFMVAAGALVALASPYRQWSYAGRVLLGLGLIFLGMGFMKGAVAPLRGYPALAGLLAYAGRYPVLGVLLATVITGIVQASAATIALGMSLAGAGVLDFGGAIALVLGANIGTTVTALLSSIGGRRPAVQTAVVHFVYKVAGVALVLPFVWLLSRFEAVFALGGGIERAIANFHTAINVAWLLLALPCTRLLARLTRALVPDERAPAEPTYLDDSLLDTPEAALDALAREAGRMAALVERQIEQMLPALLDYSGIELEKLQYSDEQVDLAHRRSIEYVRKLAARELSDRSIRVMGVLIYVLRDLEAIGDLVSKDVVPLGYKRLNADKSLAMGDVAALRRLSECVRRSTHAIAAALLQPVFKAPVEHPEIRQGLEVAAAATKCCQPEFQSAQAEHFGKLAAGVKEAVESDAVFVDFLAIVRQLYYICGDIAGTLLAPPGGASR